MAHPPPIAGELVVVALKAYNRSNFLNKLMSNVKAPAKQDPFCLFRVGNVVKRTKVDHGGGLYPIWDDQVNIPVAAGIHQMHVQIFDKDTKPNNLMGEGVIDLTRVLREKEHDGYFPLQYKGRPNCGDIYLELTFYLAQHTAARPQQQVRYQYPAGHVPGGTYQQRTQHSPYPSQPPQPQQSHYSPQPQQPQYTQQYTPQHRPVPQQHRPLPSPMQQRPPPIQIQQHRPHPPQQHRPMGQQRPMHPLPVAPQQHSPYPQPRPSSSMGTQQFSPAMPSPRPLLSAAYNPGLSPGMRPTNVPYPNYQSGPPPAGFHENQRPPMNYPMRPPPPSNGYNQRPYPPY
ncbi:hypothetical protein INT48_004017 [Thamnidium elegans]|uniref:C2 domain-containing protein n=1 Tax=Thamnidium elegans TaxID=101142 RepID=A0A8H7SIZ6_9FUNG|nr:hypothetical protein INT48_004017 [Thamnidium elegans]